MCSKFMPYQLATSVGTASRPAQPASFFTISPWPMAASDMFTLKADMIPVLAGLERIPGMDERKAERFGAAFLEILAEYR